MKTYPSWRSPALLTALTISSVVAAPDGIEAAGARFGILGRAVDTASAYCTRLIGMVDVTTTSTSTKPTRTIVTRTTLPPCTSTVSLASLTVTYSSGTTLPGTTTTITNTLAGSTTTVPGTSVYTPTVTTTVVYTVTSTTSVGPAPNTNSAVAFKIKRQDSTMPLTSTTTSIATTSASTTAPTTPASASSSGYCSVTGVPAALQSDVCAVLSRDCSSYITPRTTIRSTTIFPSTTSTFTVSPRCATTTLSVTTFTTDVVYTIRRANVTRTTNVTPSLATFTSYVTTVTASPTVVTTNSTVTVSSSTTAAPSCAYTGSSTRVDTASNGQQYFVYVDSFYSNYQSGDRAGETSYGSEQNCLDACTNNPNCFYFIYSPDYQYCEQYVNKPGGYCQSPSSDFICGYQISSQASNSTTTVSVTTTTTSTTVFNPTTSLQPTTSTSTTSTTTSTSTTTTTASSTNGVPTGVFVASTQAAPPPQATGPCYGGGQYTEIDTMSNGDQYGLCPGDCLNAGDLANDAFILNPSDPENVCTVYCSSYGGCVAGSVGKFAAGSGPGFCNGQACRVCYLKSSIGRVQNCAPIFDTYYKFSTSQIA